MHGLKTSNEGKARPAKSLKDQIHEFVRSSGEAARDEIRPSRNGERQRIERMQTKSARSDVASPNRLPS